MKISAKGMFKKLGYKQEKTLNERFISYKKPYGTGFIYIQFDLKDKTYEAFYLGQNGRIYPQILSIKEILAIQKQFEELGDEFTYECTTDV